MGVPQGSVLGPLLFLIYINAMAHQCPNLKMGLFADDTIVPVEADTITKAYYLVQPELNKLSKYFSANGLVINYKKSTETLFYNKRPFLLPNAPPLMLDGHIIPNTK